MWLRKEDTKKDLSLGEESKMDLFLCLFKSVAFCKTHRDRLWIDSDHFTKFVDFDIEVDAKRPERLDIFKFNKEDSQVEFKCLILEEEEKY